MIDILLDRNVRQQARLGDALVDRPRWELRNDTPRSSSPGSTYFGRSRRMTTSFAGR
jgi:hypothetical protein